MMGKKIIAFGMTLAFMLMVFPSVSMALEQESVAALTEQPEVERMPWTQSEVTHGSHSESEGNGELSELYTLSGSGSDAGTPEQPFTAAAPRELAMTTAAAGIWLTVPGIVGGQICFDASTGAITDCAENVSVADIPETIDGVRVTDIGNSAFEDCDKLTNVTIPDSVESIGKRAFEWCTNLLIVTIGNSVESIGESAFAYCENLTSVTIPDSVMSIGSIAFYGCTNLASVTFGNSVESIGESAFAYCENLTSVTIPDSVKSIGDYAFESCESLTSVAIPVPVESIGDHAFSFCAKLTAINVDDANNHYTSIDGVLFNEECTELIVCPGGRAGACLIPSSVESICDCAFGYCHQLTTVNVDEANSRYASIDGVLFNKECSELIVCPGGRDDACIIPSSVKSIGKFAFEERSKLTAINVDAENNNFASIDGVLFNKACTELIVFPDGRAGAYSVPDCVENIRQSAFYGCTNLTSVTIPDSVGDIERCAFYDCTKLTSVTIPNSVKRIKNETFGSCKSLKNVTIPNSVEVIEMMAFYNCDSLTSVTIGNSVMNIEQDSFSSCNSLRGVYFKGAAPIDMGGPIIMGGDAFWKCASDFTIYYVSGQQGWTTPTWHGYRTALWEERTPTPSGGSTHDFEDTTYSSDAPSLQPDGSLQYTVNADIGKYISTSVDGITLGNSDVTVTPGSTIVSIGAAYMAKLPDGAHTLRVQFIDGHADTVFTTSLSAASGAVSIPATGDTPVWTLTIALLCVFSAICVLRRKRT